MCVFICTRCVRNKDNNNNNNKHTSSVDCAQYGLYNLKQFKTI